MSPDESGPRHAITAWRKALKLAPAERDRSKVDVLAVAELDAVDNRLDELEVVGQAVAFWADFDGDVAVVVVEEVRRSSKPGRMTRRPTAPNDNSHADTARCPAGVVGNDSTASTPPLASTTAAT